jgi:NCAIR mutase (PurE)-related protein
MRRKKGRTRKFDQSHVPSKTEQDDKLTPDTLETILRQFKAGSISLDQALERLKAFPFADLGFAKVDLHRRFRKGFPEVVFASGKTIDQLTRIILCLDRAGQNILATRVTPEVHKALSKTISGLSYNPLARTVVKQNEPIKTRPGIIMVICAGTSDIPVAEEAAVTAELMGNKVEKAYDVGVAGIHRLLDAKDRLHKARVIIVVAGMEGALASVVAGMVAVPVVAVPTSVGYGASFGGLAALLGMLNSCSSGVAIVNIDNGFGAGFIAHLINSL